MRPRAVRKILATEHQGALTTKGTEKRATKNMQLLLQHCCKTSWKAMLHVLPHTFKPVNNLTWCKTGSTRVVKRATSLCNSFCSNVAKQVSCLLSPVFPYLKGTFHSNQNARFEFSATASGEWNSIVQNFPNRGQPREAYPNSRNICSAVSKFSKVLVECRKAL